MTDYGDMLMRPFRIVVSTARVAFTVGTLALTGCVPSAYVYDTPQNYYNGGGNGYYSTVQPSYYGYPGYYTPTRYPPPVVYLDHDYDRNDRNRGGHDGDKYGDRHDPGHGWHDDGRNDHDRHDREAVGSPPHHPSPPGVNPDRPPPHVAPPQGSGPSPPVPPGRNPCAGSRKCGPSGEAPESRPPQKVPGPRTPVRRGTDSREDGREAPP